MQLAQTNQNYIKELANRGCIHRSINLLNQLTDQLKNQRDQQVFNLLELTELFIPLHQEELADTQILTALHNILEFYDSDSIRDKAAQILLHLEIHDQNEWITQQNGISIYQN